MSPALPYEEELFNHPTEISGTVFVNDRVCVQTEEDQRVISVHGVVFSHYSVKDRAAEAYAMVLLFESGYADQNDIARCFGYSARSLRRYQERLRAGGLSALARPRGRPSGSPSGHKKTHKRDQTILRLKTKGMSNRWIAGRLGLSETAVRKSLGRLGWKSDPDPEPDLPFLPEADSQARWATVTVSKLIEIPPSAAEQPPRQRAQFPIDSAAKSLDADPLDRSMDRLLAAMGLLDDALPLFAATRSLPRAGVLLAIPTLVASGLLSTAEKIYGRLGPAFYGLRTTLVAYVLLALLRIPRPEALKEYPPGELGRIVGLDRMPEVKTLRRKLARLASLKGSYQLGREIARQRIAERGKVLGFLYIDGHVRAYHGKHTIPKAYVTRMHLAAPASTDYWVNDQRGDPLFVVTADANAGMTRMLMPVLREVRELLGPRRHSTIVFDRGGWSPKLFQDLLAMGFDLLTYRKGRTRHIAEKRFTWHKAMDYQVEPDDPNRSVPNPVRKAVEKEIHTARVHLKKLRQSYGATAIDYFHGRSRTMAGFEIQEKKIRAAIDKTIDGIKKLKIRRAPLPARVPLVDARKGQELVKLSTERKHLTNILKMIAYQMESDLVELVRPRYKRVEDEGRTLIQSALQDMADIEPTVDQLRITLAPLSSPHRSRVLEALCELLNKTNTLFPGTQLRLRYSVAPSHPEAKSGHISD